MKSNNKYGIKAVSLMKNGIDITKESNSYYRKLFILSNFSAGNIFRIYAMYFIMVQALMFVTEIVILGEPKATYFDTFVIAILIFNYFQAVNRLSNFLIAQTVEPKKSLRIVK